MLTDSDVVVINVTQVNDAPVNSVPGPQATAEDTPKVFSAGNGNLISISDVDDADTVPSAALGDETVQVTLTAANGVLTLSGVAGLSFSFSDANGTGTGDGPPTPDDVPRPDQFYQYRAGRPELPAHLELQRRHQPDDHHQRPGNFGTGGVLTDSDTVNITVAQSTTRQ